MPTRIVTHLARNLGEQSVRKRPVLKAIFGVVLVILGGLAVLAPSHSAFISVRIAGVFLIVAGVVQAGVVLTADTGDAPAPSLALSIPNVLSGAFFLLEPHTSILLLSLVLAAIYVVFGLYKAVTSYLKRVAHWPWMVFLGLLVAAFGALIALQWPGSGLTVIGRFVGINLIVEGVTWLTILRRTLRDARLD